MSRQKRTSPSENQVRVDISLLGLDKNGCKRTQRMVSDHLGMASSTVCEAVRALMDGGYIVLTDGSRRDKFYSTGPRFPFIESIIQDRLRDDSWYLRSVQRTRRAAAQPEPSGVLDGTTEVNGPEVPHDVYSVHVADSWLQFAVDRQGSVDRTVYEYVNPRTGERSVLEQTIFGKGTEYELDGSRNWADTFVLEHGRSYRIRYQVTTGGRRFFYVSPDFEVTVSASVAEDDDACLRAIVGRCTPLLIWLERNAGWVFAKDGLGMYALQNSYRTGDIHRCYRGPLNDVITELTGGAFVDTGHGVWADDSPGYTELETNRPDYIQAIRDLPQTRQRVNTVWAEWPAAKEGLAELEERVDALARIVHRMYEIDRDLAQMHTSSQRVRALETGRSAYGGYQVGGDPQGRPPEGYQ